MNPNDREPGSEEMEQPIQVLRDQEHDTASDFLARVRNRINRRSSTAHVAAYSWNMPKIVVVEMISMFSHVLTSLSGKRRSQ